ncbi:cold shock domain-containing protein [Pleionea sediminis]|uniref:cold shock domain-containing protein n=1 Tax=Pleionea sediminis TaxID=2569479 RepID=UPI00197C9BBD|nr:cold shock domain-containing protein [Pleionea sediminis]
MLTSHEFMVANKKRRKNDNNQKNKKQHQGGNEFFSQGQYDDNRGNRQPGHNKNRNTQSGQGQQQQFQKPQHQQEYDNGYVPEVEEGKVYEGIVQNYYREKGYGFIRCESFKVPAFFHYSEIQLDGFKYLIKQQKVEFKARVSDEGKLQAYEVNPTELAPTQKRQIFNKDKSDKKD